MPFGTVEEMRFLWYSTHTHTLAAETGMTHILTGLEAEVFEAVVSLICLLTPLSLAVFLSGV